MSEPIKIWIPEASSVDELRSLRAAINSEPELRGSAALDHLSPKEGTLGSISDILLVTLGPGGAAAVLAQVLVVWIKHRRTNISLRVKRSDGTEIELNAEQIKQSDTLAIRQLASTVANTVEEGDHR